MLRNKVSQEYARWWQFWLSKLPQGDKSLSASGNVAGLNKNDSFSIPGDRLRYLRNHAKSISPLLCPTTAIGLYVDEES